jgi:dTDP-glucose pyrophosphorylase
MSVWIRATVQIDASVRDAIRTIDECGLQIALVVGPDMQLAGLVTDGDVRRAMLRGIELSAPVEKIMNRNPKTGAAAIGRISAVETMRAADIEHLPLVDRDGRLVGVEMLHSGPSEVENDYCAVIMAGGFGKRLSPLTDFVPKPLLKIGDRPILERIIDSLAHQGFKRLFISVNYKAQMIRDFCGDGSQWGVRISYLEEREPRGTAGALALLPKSCRRCVVMNGDILTDLNFRALIEFHDQQNSPATMCVREQRTQIQYGVVQFDGPFVSDIVEKPYHSCFINAGIYVFDERGLALVPETGYFDMPTLFKQLVEEGQRPGAFPIREFWLDIGTPADFKLAQSEGVGRVRPGFHVAQVPQMAREAGGKSAQVIRLRS